MSKKDSPNEGGAAELRPETPPDAPPNDAPPAPPVPAPAIPEDGKRTPREWATELGHVDLFVKEGKRRPISDAKGYIFAAVAAHCGWGKQRAIDERLTRAEYEEAVAEALATPIGKPHQHTNAPPLKWRHDARARAEGASQ